MERGREGGGREVEGGEKRGRGRGEGWMERGREGGGRERGGGGEEGRLREERREGERQSRHSHFNTLQYVI